MVRQRPATSTLANLAFIVWQSVRRRKVRHLGKMLRDHREFVTLGGRMTDLYPIFDEYLAGAGSVSGHYFHQDLLVAQFIHDAAPARHIDVGSQVDGFVAHVASFRPIEVIDIRPMPLSTHSNIRFLQADLMRPNSDLESCADSLS